LKDEREEEEGQEVLVARRVAQDSSTQSTPFPRTPERGVRDETKFICAA